MQFTPQCIIDMISNIYIYIFLSLLLCITPTKLVLVPTYLQAIMTLFFLFIFLSITCFSKPSSSIVLCPLIEKHSLLSFKHSLQDPDHELSSWDAEVNCCKWKGVVCNNSTGHVHHLHLHGLKGLINPSLLNLTHLTSLDLSLNDFGPTIPSFIGSFPNLQHLNLSFAGFFGKIPHSLGNLSYLLSLDLGGFPYMEVAYPVKYPNILDVDSLDWLSGVSKLEYLNMNFVNLSKATNWVQVINTLPSLLQLNLHNCSIDYIPDPMLPLMNITSLTFLDLSFNNFHSFALPRWIFRLNSLLYLDLGNNSFIGPIPSVSNLTKIQFIDLSFNLLNSTIPSWLYSCKDLEFVSLEHNFLHGTIPAEFTNLCKIRELDLGFNNFEGKMSDSFENMSECFLGSLETLELSSNKLSGNLIDELGELKSLQFLSVCLNSLSGRLPINLGKLSSLKYLGLSGNQFTGSLPDSLGQLCNLEALSITDNKLEGVVTEIFFANLTKLERMGASYNHLTLKVSQHWIPPFQLKGLTLGSWNLGEGSHIPSWIQKHKSITALDLSNTGISGSVPNWFWHIQYLNLSHNRLHGKFPDLHGYKDIQFLYLSSNRFEGLLPRVGDSLRELDLSNNSFSGGISHFLCEGTYHAYALEFLHLGENQLSGELPDCWMKWPSLRYLSLANNDMFGNIPPSIGFLAKIHSLNLDSNKFSGGIPYSMRNCTKLIKISLENNNLGGNIPRWIGRSLVKLRILILRSNNFSGEICSEICHLSSLQILDLSNNNLSGIIPRCLNKFTAMALKRSLPDPLRSLPDPFISLDDNDDFIYVYSLQIGVFIDSALIVKKGSEMQYGRILPLVTSIDLSMNYLSGDIPSELTSLLELGSLNLSRNHLSSVIPENIGDMKQLESLDLSRNSLRGQIPNSLALISTLDYLDLSYNNLTGRIPEGTQLQSFNPSCFIGNNLCGLPLTSNCSGDGDGDGDGQKEMNEGEDHKAEVEWFYLLLSLGYAVGFSVVCTTLVLNKPWRDAYFGLLGWMWNQLYVYAGIKWTRLTTPSGSS